MRTALAGLRRAWDGVGAWLGPARWARAAALVFAWLAIADVVVGGFGAFQAAVSMGAAVTSPGVVVSRLEPCLRTALLGLAALAWLIELWPRPNEATLAHTERTAPSLGRASARVLGALAFLLVLAGYRDTMRGEVFASAFGEAQFWGDLALADLAGPGTFALLVAALLWALARWSSPAPKPDVVPPLTRCAGGVERVVGLGLYLGCLISLRHYLERLAGPLYGSAHAVVIEVWQCWLAALLVLGVGLPGASLAELGDWMRRVWRPVALLVVLEAVRVVWQEDRYRGWMWMASDRVPVPPVAVFLRGRVHEWTGILVSGAATLLAIAVLAGLRWRRARPESR